ncbi:hypothetical protein DAPPUDRAFT_243392 [Daphnia pulex]|uniref:Uncharacterized protein n=1 Tax=Daphnia pulex TaxID=6669 RepID=E9GIN6_DAPPU|nr:hypothetical protein DAPPUDRAFT_243392 [Daphnia pulex]|eukprot:EFX80686.1 hypothetical protein DAPPUDRAFT_243392 [Daphnia pulex]
MESADESVDGSHYSRMHVASICGSPSMSATVTSNNGNPFCLFYSPTLAIQHNSNVIQSSRASNSWIASLRSTKYSSSRSPIMSGGRQHELSERDNGGGWINISTGGRTGAFDYGRSPSIDGSSFSSSSSPHSLLLPSSSSFRQWGSLESIQRNQRLRQLAAQSKTKVRSISARESTAAAERWRYIQTVLERRRKESLVSRERFIRQPLDNILRQKAGAVKQVAQAPVVWDSLVAGRSILKRRALNWRAKAGRHVHFDSNQQANEANNDNSQNGEKLPQLPVVSIPEETEAPGSNESFFTNEEDQRLPLLLMTPSPRLEIITDGQQHDPGDDDDTTLQRVSPSGPSWVERQVAKVRQRKLWAFRQQQQQQQQQKLNHHPPRTILKRSVSLLVNVPDEPDTDSLNEEEEGDRSDSGQPVDDADQHDDDGIHRNNNNRQSLAWEVSLDKDEFVEMSSDQIKDAEATADDPYGGWPHFPVKLAICIQQRQKSLKERSKAGRKGKEEATTTTTTTGSEGKFHPNNSFERRKRFGKWLSIAVVRQRKRRIPKRGPLSSIHQPRASRQSGESRQPTPNADDIKGHDPAAVPANPIPDDVVGQCLTNAIPLQVLDAADLRLSVNADAIPEISRTHNSNEIDSPVASSSPISSRSDQISEADVMTPQAALLDDSSAGPESEAETIAADAQSHLDEMIPAADDSMAKDSTDDEDDDHTAGSAFSSSPPPTSRAGQRRRQEITDADETISDVTVDDGPYLIDQPAESTNVFRRKIVLKAIPPQQDVGMASRLDNIPAAAGISPVEQTEFRTASPPLGSSSISGIDNKDSGSPADGTRLAAYCSGWPMAISNQNGGDAIPYSPMATVSDWNNFEAPTSEETMAGTINRPEVDVSSDDALALTIPAAQKDSNHPPVVADSSTAVIIQTSLDKKTKEARNASRILFPPAVTSTPTQTEPPPPGSKEDDRAEEGNKCRSSTDSTMPGDVKESDEETGSECQCLHRAVLTCLLPEAAETLANLELIRRQLKKARIRRQGMSDQPAGRQPLQLCSSIKSVEQMTTYNVLGERSASRGETRQHNDKQQQQKYVQQTTRPANQSRKSEREWRERGTNSAVNFGNEWSAGTIQRASIA